MSAAVNNRKLLKKLHRAKHMHHHSLKEGSEEPSAATS